MRSREGGERAHPSLRGDDCLWVTDFVPTGCSCMDVSPMFSPTVDCSCAVERRTVFPGWVLTFFLHVASLSVGADWRIL